jgi:DNA polymerase (family 10)
VTPDNALIAARLGEFAALLELADASHYSVRAYARAAELVRTAPISVAELVRAGRVRELKGIGPSIERRLRELVETGDLAEMVELRRSRSLELAALGRLLGIGAKRATEIGAALGITTVAQFRTAVAEGRLHEVPGIGPKTEARIVAALSNERPATPRVLLPQARAICENVAAALGGVVAGDARRWLDAPIRLAVVVASEDSASVRERFAQLPEVVALLDPDTGITAEGGDPAARRHAAGSIGNGARPRDGPCRARRRARRSAGRPRRAWSLPGARPRGSPARDTERRPRARAAGARRGRPDSR